MELLKKNNVLRGLIGFNVRLYLGDYQTGVDALEETDLEGTVEYTSKDVPTLVHNGLSSVVPVQSVVRIQCTETGKDFYRHPTYSIPTFSIAEDRMGMHVVFDEHYNRYMASRQVKRCVNWVNFMTGECYRICDSKGAARTFRVRGGIVLESEEHFKQCVSWLHDVGYDTYDKISNHRDVLSIKDFKKEGCIFLNDSGKYLVFKSRNVIRSLPKFTLDELIQAEKNNQLQG